MSGWLLIDPVWSPEWVWLRYATFLRATVLIGIVAAAAGLLGRAPASVRAALWAGALLALLPLPGLRALPLHWGAHVVPPLLAAPMMAAGATLVAQSSPAAVGVPWTSVIAAVWLLGALIVVARLVVGWRTASGVIARAEPVVSEGWHALVEESAGVLGVRRPVRLLRSADTPVPLTLGTWRPAILVPPGADAWPETHRRAVLLHELAHVRRLDCLFGALAHLACALWWFHPAAWWAAHRLRVERERACDERVLLAGVRPSDYAECLLRIADAAHGVHEPAARAAAGLLRRPGLRDRVRTILKPARRPPRAAHPAAAVVALGSMLPVVLLVGSMRLSPRPDVLWAALQSPDWPTRAFAAENIARFGDPGALAALHAALREEAHPTVHATVAFGGRLRARDRPGVRRFGWPDTPSP